MTSDQGQLGAPSTTLAVLGATEGHARNGQVIVANTATSISR